MAKRKGLTTAIRRKFFAMPCVICGDSGDIEVDHIVPVAKGGTNDESNLQPLCHQCHARKGNKRARSNEELKAMYEANPKEHHLRNRYRLATRYTNPYDGPGYMDWRARNA